MINIFFLVGQIRLGRNLPWEDSGYFCVFNEDLVKYDESYIARTFQQSELGIAYDSAEGRYLVTRLDRQGAGLVKLVVFSKEKEMQEASAYEAKEHRRAQIIEEERQRLLKEYASKYKEFLPKGVLQNKGDLDLIE